MSRDAEVSIVVYKFALKPGSHLCRLSAPCPAVTRRLNRDHAALQARRDRILSVRAEGEIRRDTFRSAISAKKGKSVRAEGEAFVRRPWDRDPPQ